MEEISQVFYSAWLYFWAVLKTWWWVLPPLILWRPFIYLYKSWRNDAFSNTFDSMLLEIRMPNEVDRPFKAMEQVFAGFWMLYDPPDWWEEWIEGKYQVSFTIEIVSNGGDICFYLRFPKALRNLIESSIYAQYPDVELSEAEDYTQKVPQNIPNKEWDLWGCDYEFLKPDFYPIKTYAKFFEESPAAKEEKRVDPLPALLEGMAQLNPGEQAWVQIRVKPITIAEDNYKERAKKDVDKLASRPEEKEVKRYPLIKEALDVLITGEHPGLRQEEEKTETFLPPEMKLTPGEREVVAGIESKISKTMFNCFIRFMILGERDSWNKANLKNILGFFANFNTENLNAFKPWGPSITKIHKHERGFTNLFFHDSLLFAKKRKLWRKYIKRLNYEFPKKDKTFILNTEELATVFHIIGRQAVPAPTISRVEARRAEPPPHLPG